MIKSFKNKDTERVFHEERVAKFAAIADRAQRKLLILEAATSLKGLNYPSNRLEKLSGDRDGQYSIRINRQYRICFNWTDEGPENVEITDYH